MLKSTFARKTLVGQDAVGSQIRQMQSMLHKQLTGKAMTEKTEQEWVGTLVEAMTMRRALVVLDDPWLPEQVRFLNPIDRSGRTEHRLLVTTRIRDLVPKATWVELTQTFSFPCLNGCAPNGYGCAPKG